MLFALLAAAIFTLIAWYYNSNAYRKHKYLSKFPGQPKLPFFGNLFDVLDSKDLLPWMLQAQEKYGGIIYTQIGPIDHNLDFSEPKAVEFLLGSNKLIEKSLNYRFLLKWLGRGLLTSTGPYWRRHRKLLTPSFHFKILEDFVEVFNSDGEVLIDKLRTEVGKESTDIYPYITLCTLDIICNSTMGVSVNAQKQNESEYVRSVKEMLRIVIDRLLNVFKMFEPTYRFTADYKTEKRCLEVLHGFTKTVIKQRREELRSKRSGEEERNEFGIKKRRNFLDLLLEAKDPDGKSAFDDTEIREQVDTFMFEGHDTTASAISFTLYNLANHPEAQENAMKELREIFGHNPDKPATYQDLQDMKYLECVIKESLRLYPSVPLIGRLAREDIEFEGKLIPRGTNVGVFIFGIHRDEKLFPEPTKFKPERFASNDKQYPYEFVPFSAGPRNCIGQKFAMMEMKATISKVLRNFKLLPAVPEHQLVLIPDAVLKSATGIKLQLENRIYCFNRMKV